MRFGGFVPVILVGAFLAPGAQASEPLTEDCAAPPCGPITVIITIILEQSRNIKFGDKDVFETKGKASFFFDIDTEGYAYDPQEEVYMTLAVHKEPAWTKTTITPTKVKVPVRPQDGCTDCVRPDPADPSQIEFYWETDVAVKVEKKYDPTPEEVKKKLKADGTYRVSISGSSNDSMFGTPATANVAGLTEGYGPKDLRFLPEHAKMPAAGEPGAAGEAPGLGMLGLLAAAGLAVGVWRRRD